MNWEEISKNIIATFKLMNIFFPKSLSDDIFYIIQEKFLFKN
jgi:hypothetical protein